MLDKHFESVTTVITVVMTTYLTSYNAIHSSDKYFSFTRGGGEEKKRKAVLELLDT